MRKRLSTSLTVILIAACILSALAQDDAGVTTTYQQAYHAWRQLERAAYQTTAGRVVVQEYQAWRQAEQVSYRQVYHHAYSDSYHAWRHSEWLLHQQPATTARSTKFRM